MAAKRSVYLQDVDLERLEAVRESLEEEFPVHKVNNSWVFRYALYRLYLARGLGVGPGPSPVGGEGAE